MKSNIGWWFIQTRAGDATFYRFAGTSLPHARYYHQKHSDATYFLRMVVLIQKIRQPCCCIGDNVVVRLPAMSETHSYNSAAVQENVTIVYHETEMISSNDLKKGIQFNYKATHCLLWTKSSDACFKQYPPFSWRIWPKIGWTFITKLMTRWLYERSVILTWLMTSRLSTCNPYVLQRYRVDRRFVNTRERPYDMTDQPGVS